jgi:hypothetical protein
MNLLSIGNDNFEASYLYVSDYFAAKSGAPSLPLSIDHETMTAYVSAQVGFQSYNGTKWARFAVNLASNNTVVYSSACENCQSPYFDLSGYQVFRKNKTQVGPPKTINDGYSLAISQVSSPLCLKNVGENDFYCSYSSVQVGVATSVSSNYWNEGVPQYEGLLGLSDFSATFTEVLGDLPNCQSTLGKVLTLSNLTDWTPFDPNFVPTSTKNSLSVCSSGSDPTVFIKPALLSYPESQLVG